MRKYGEKRAPRHGAQLHLAHMTGNTLAFGAESAA